MKKKRALEWSEYATHDVENIVDHLMALNPTAAINLVQEIDNKVGYLSTHPQMGRTGRVEGTRELVIPKNYIVVYTENPMNVVIRRVLHSKQQWPK